MRIRCECGWEKDVDDALAGKKGRCPKCQTKMILTPIAERLADKSAISIASQAASAVGSAFSIGLNAIVKKPAAGVTAITASVDQSVNTALDWLCDDGQDKTKVAVIVEKVQQILMDDEEIEYLAIQSKPLVNMFPDAAVLTNHRFIVYRVKMLGRIDFEDYIWRELRDAKLSENIIGSTISFNVGGATFSLDYLPKVQARKIYRIAQKRELDALEERRNRKMEEDRARAGGVTVQTAINATPAAQPLPDPVARLGQLKQMLDAGLISQEEFDKKKADILSAM
jgi:hypothetical protein